MIKLRNKAGSKPFEIGDATFEGKTAKNILRGKGTWTSLSEKFVYTEDNSNLKVKKTTIH